MFVGCYEVFQIKGRQQIGREERREKNGGIWGIFVWSSKKPRFKNSRSNIKKCKTHSG
jgi:hypothetical protein